MVARPRGVRQDAALAVKAALLTHPRHIDVVEVNVPAVPAGHVLVGVQQCGICTSDLDLWAGKATDRLAIRLGHEVAGVVAEVGDGVSTIGRGDRVAAWVRCGGFAEHIVVHERHCLAVAERVAYRATDGRERTIQRLGWDDIF